MTGLEYQGGCLNQEERMINAFVLKQLVSQVTKDKEMKETYIILTLIFIRTVANMMSLANCNIKRGTSISTC